MGKSRGLSADMYKKKWLRVWEAVRKACQRAVEKRGKEKGKYAAGKNTAYLKRRIWIKIKTKE